MSLVAFHVAGGDALFSGVAFIVVACFGLLRCQSPRWAAVFRLLAVLGAILIATSATPLPPWFYAVWGAALVVWLGLPVSSTSRRWQPVRSTLPVLVVVLSLSAVTVEGVRHRRVTLPPQRFSTLAVIGDSVSAGMLGPDEPVWPRQFEEIYGVRVLNVAEAGATARSARQQAERLPSEPLLVLVEIGGNDLLGSTSTEQFAVDLRRLLETVYRRGDTIVMLELPLPPLFNRYGRIQRELAAKYDVHLIHRRTFAGVLAAAEGTLDSIHLSESGHRRMAETIWQHLEPALRPAASSTR